VGTVNFVLASLAALTSASCTWLLFRAYAASEVRLLLWSGLCFVFLTLNNVLLFLDLVVFPDIDFRPYRLTMRSRNGSARRTSASATPISCAYWVSC
jgi:hypothetical protein